MSDNASFQNLNQPPDPHLPGSYLPGPYLPGPYLPEAVEELLSPSDLPMLSPESIETVFSTLLNQSAQLIWLLDAAGNVLKANQTALTFGNLDAEQVMARPVYEVWQFSGGEQLRLKTAIAAATQGRHIHYDATITEARHPLPVGDGTVLPQEDHPVTTLNIILHIIGQASDQPVLLMMEGVDVSDRKQVEAQLLRSQRFQSVGKMAVGLAHDLINLLTPIIGSAHLLRLEFPEATQEQNELFKVMNTCASRASQLARQMLTFSRGQTESFSPIASEHLLLEVQTLIRAAFPVSIAIETSLPPGLWSLVGNENQLHQILINLCLNARDAMPQGGSLKLSAENIQIDQPDHSEVSGGSATVLGNYVAIQVADTGVGIPDHILDRIFDPFFTTKATGLGTGLGLSNVADIIESHGGFVDVVTESTQISGTGTQFWLYLPALP